MKNLIESMKIKSLLTGFFLLFGFFLPGDSILFSAGLVAASHGNINIVILVTAIFLAAFFGDQVGFVIGRVIGRPYLDKRESPRQAKQR